MQLASIDIAIILAYLAGTLGLGLYISRLASKNMGSYFLAGNRIPWWALGVSNASGMFDIAGTMWLVSVCFVYGLKSAWLPWVWPIFNQIFLMIYLSVWLRRSNVMTGAEWLQTRFGKTREAKWCQFIVILFALVSAVGFIAYAFKGIGKFAEIFFPWDLSADNYALIIFSITVLYVIKGGMYSVVFTEVLQFVLMTIAAIAVGIIAMSLVTPEQIKAATPDGWDTLLFSWRLDLNWSGVIDSVNQKIQQDNMELFGLMIMMMLFKGTLTSMAGPVPSYDMQRILATKSPKEAAKMSGLVSLVMFFPRYMMVTGLTVLALVYLGPDIQLAGGGFDFEQVLPYAITEFVPIGLKGLLIAGLLAAFMSTLAASLNAAPVYFVNDVYKRYIKPNQSERTYVKVSYVVSLVLVITGVVVGLFLDSINDIMQWIFGALFGGYAAANLLKWHWWRFNAGGYFWGMLTGLVAALIFPLAMPDLHPLMAFPYLLLVSVAGCILGTLLTKADDIEHISEFYRQVRPWGVWKPIKDKLLRQNPSIEVSATPGRDLTNVAVGVVWQLSLVVAPIYLIIQNWEGVFFSLLITVLTSIFLKFNWLNKLDEN